MPASPSLVIGCHDGNNAEALSLTAKTCEEFHEWWEFLLAGNRGPDPGRTYTFSDEVSLLATLCVPYGQPPEDGVLRSEDGTAPPSGLLQLQLYL